MELAIGSRYRGRARQNPDVARRSWWDGGLAMRRWAVAVAGVTCASLAFSSGATAASWSAVEVPSPVYASGHLSNVSCPTPSMCVAVGSFDNGGRKITLAERWNGSGWSVQATANPADGTGWAVLNSVACTSSRSCIAVGESSAGALAERWDGTRWSIQRTPRPRQGSAALMGVSCTSARACAAVGSIETSIGEDRARFSMLAERWNGTRWSIQKVPGNFTADTSPGGYDTGSTERGLNSVACTSQTNCFAVGSLGAKRVVEQWDGRKWSIRRTGAVSVRLVSISCATSVSCFAVGNLGPRLVVWRWNGDRWAMQRLAHRGYLRHRAQLSGVSCSSARACTAVGSTASYPAAPGSRGVVLRWDGRQWTSQQSSPTPAGATGTSLTSVACPARTSCTAVGEILNDNTYPPSSSELVEHWSGGTAWTIQEHRGAVGTVSGELRAVACGSSTDCIAIGSWPTSISSNTFAERWDGSRWSIQTTPNPSSSRLFSVSCGSPTACIAVGQSAGGQSAATPLTEVWNGSAWSIAPAAVPPAATGVFLNAVSCTFPSACTAVGAATNATGGVPLAEHWNGSAWSIQPIPTIPGGTFFPWAGMSCSSDSRCVAVGRYQLGGTVKLAAASWDGTDWTVQDMPTPPGLNPYNLEGAINAVSCSSTTNCIAVGAVTETWDGVSWTLQPAPPHVATSVSCTSPTACVAVGSEAAEVWDGTGWTAQQIPVISGGTDPTLNGVACMSDSACIAVGSYKSPTGSRIPLAERYR